MNNKNWRIKNAKLARAYMEGGMAPFQTAKKLRFHSVMDMEAAIHQLEKLEEHPPVERVPLNKIGEWREGPFMIKKFSASQDYPEMIRIWAGDRPNYIWLRAQEAGKLVDAINSATGVMDNLYAEFQELKEERNAEAKGHYDEPKRNEQLEERVRELEAELQGAGMIGVKVDVDADTKAVDEELKAQNKALTDENIALANALREQNESILRLKEKIANLVMAG